MRSDWKARLAIPFPVLRGENKRMLWSLGTGKNYFMNRFEPEKVRAIAAVLRPDEAAWDIGAHRGYFTLLMSQRVGLYGSVVSFEPDPTNLILLKRHVMWNRVTNVTVKEMALANTEGKLWFARGKSSLAGKLDLDGDLLVQVCNPGQLITSRQCSRPTFVKIDAEGAEFEILSGFGEYLRCPELALVVSTDSEELHTECTGLLIRHGFTVVDSGKREHPEPWKTFGDVELFAFGLEREPSLDVRRLVESIGAPA